MARTLATVERELAAAQRASERAAQARAALPAGSSRARVTTANAKWMRAAEHRDRLLAEAAALRSERGAA
jgi:hypothetical protein